MEVELPRDVLRNCISLGLIGCRVPSLRTASTAIFDAVRVASPDSAAWRIGVAMVHANAGDDPGEACAFMMRQGVSSSSGDLLCRAFLALFLVMAGRIAEAERVARAIVGDGTDPDACRLSRSLLEHEIGVR